MTSVVTDNNFGAHVDLSMYKLLVVAICVGDTQVTDRDQPASVSGHQ